jgi:multiple antibiotic resistance protein
LWYDVESGCGADSLQRSQLAEVHLTDTTWIHAATIFMGFFAIMNPIANTPVFLALTEGDDAATKKRVARSSLLLALVLVALFSLTGNLIFDLFGITLHAFRITGGVLVFYIGAHMLHGEPSPVHNPSTEDNRKSREAALGVAVTPLAVPILAGPGTLATAMSYTAAGTAMDTLVTILCFAGLCVVSYGLFIFGEHFIHYIGESAVKVITRMMGLILAVIGVQMLIQGVQGAMG